MIPYLSCEAARELLFPFVDGELTVADQIAIESHLGWCSVCAAHVADLRVIGISVRVGVPGSAVAADDEHDLTAIQSGVLARIRAEREQSFGVRVRDLFGDMRLFWPAIGATTSVLACLFAALGVFAAATEQESAQSMAGMIQLLANRLSVPRALDADMVVDSIVEDEAVYALSGIVTREGRIENYELLTSGRPNMDSWGPAGSAEEVIALLDAFKRSRFEPVQNADGPVAVNMVWLVTRTTVKGSATAELEPLRAPGTAAETSTPKPTPGAAAARRAPPRRSTTA